MSEWQDISTAPRDGTLAVVTNEKYEYPYIAAFERDKWMATTRGEWDEDIDYYQPTHWMPLPSPPSPSGKHYDSSKA